MKKKLPFIIAALLFTAFIWTNSMLSAAESSRDSGRVVSLVARALKYAGMSVPPHNLVTIVRKSAHITEFFIQGVLIGIALGTPFIRKAVYLLFFGILTACIDEYIQLFSVGRAGLVSDIFIDFAGTLMAALVFLIYFWIRRGKI